jgi:hypothetical protein
MRLMIWLVVIALGQVHPGGIFPPVPSYAVAYIPKSRADAVIQLLELHHIPWQLSRQGFYGRLEVDVLKPRFREPARKLIIANAKRYGYLRYVVRHRVNARTKP